jgi:hypothetical protein
VGLTPALIFRRFSTFLKIIGPGRNRRYLRGSSNQKLEGKIEEL